MEIVQLEQPISVHTTYSKAVKKAIEAKARALKTSQCAVTNSILATALGVVKSAPKRTAKKRYARAKTRRG